MAKYSKKIREHIFNLLRTDDYTQTEICKIVGISRYTWMAWRHKYPEFANCIIEAQNDLIEQRLKECKSSLGKLINGYEYEEETTEFIKGERGKPEIRAQRVTKRHVQPNLGAIIHYQTNNDPENWVNRQRMEVTGKNGEDFKLRPLTKDEIDFLIKNNE